MAGSHMCGGVVGRLLIGIGVGCLIMATGNLGAQQVSAATAMPARGTQRVTVDVENALLVTVLRTIANQAGLNPLIDGALVSSGKRVTLHVRDMPAEAAFQMALQGTGLVAQFRSEGQVAILRSDDAVVANGGIAGTVRDAKSKSPLPNVSVWIDDSSHVIHTDEDGKYRFASVLAGSHRVSVRALGFGRQTRIVTVVDGNTLTADFVLQSTANTLDQVVVTATGAQRYRELGHSVATINADSLIKEAPITSLSELLTARTPGLQVLGVNGSTVGGDVALRLRGGTTTSLDPQPIVIVDGVRYKSTNGTSRSRQFGVEGRSPLNDLNVNDIATVEIVKGPSASTLYGPDASNGVIVVTTKRGKSGAPQWHMYISPDIDASTPGGNGNGLGSRSFYGMGHVPGTATPFNGSCRLIEQGAGRCALDSVISIANPVADPQLSMVAKRQPEWHSGLSVSGGIADLSYFFSGNYDSQIGTLQLSPVGERILKSVLGVPVLSDDIRSPNTQKATSIHGNVAAPIGNASTMTFVGNYTQAVQRNIGLPAFSQQVLQGGIFPGTVLTPADSFSRLRTITGADAFLSSMQMNVRRFTGTISGTSHLSSWLTANASIGTDLDITVDRGLRPVEASNSGGESEADQNQQTQSNHEAHFGLVGLVHKNALSFRTSVGTDYSYSNLDGQTTTGFDLAPGSTNISTAVNLSISRQWTETAQLGGYAEEVLGFRDRLFLTGSLRLDGSSTFGDKYVPRPFPKVGISWIASEEPGLDVLHRIGINELRIRSSFGAASRYPTSVMKLGTISADQAIGLEDAPIVTFGRTQGANPILRPEKSQEWEYGADATIASGLQLHVSWYNRKTHDQLQRLGVPSGMLAGWANVGDLSAKGFEADADVHLVDSRSTTLSLHLALSHQTNVVRSLGAAQGLSSIFGGYVVGYPLGAVFGSRTIGYADTAGGRPDSIIVPSEIIKSPIVYLGTNFPPNTYTVSPTLTLLNGRIRLSSLFDRQSGGVEYNPIGACLGGNPQCLASFLKSTPLIEQARNRNNSTGDRIHSSDFARWRELGATFDVPRDAVRCLRLTRASMSLQVRNVALWTSSPAPDPESVPGLGLLGSGQSTNGGIGGVFPRAWTLRFDIQP